MARARKSTPHTAAPLTREVREAIGYLTAENAWEKQRLTRAARNYALLREELAILGACLLLQPRLPHHADSLALATLVQHEPAQEGELLLTIAGLLDVPEPETFLTSEVGEDSAESFEEKGGLGSADLATLSLTYRRYLYLRAVCFDG